MSRFVLFCLLSLAPLLSSAERPERIITLGSAITETVFKLNAGHRIVATDNDSHHPPLASVLPKAGQAGAIDSEALLAHKPDLIIADQSVWPPQLLTQLRASGVRVETVQFGPGMEQALDAIERVGEIIGSKSSGRWLARDNRRELQRLQARYAEKQDKLQVLVVQDGAGAAPMIGTADGSAERMVELAGGVNLATGLKHPAKPTANALGKLQPDVILVAAEGWSASENLERMLSDTGLAQNLSKRNGRIVVMPNDLLLSMGPRIGSAALQLAELMREDLEAEEDY